MSQFQSKYAVELVNPAGLLLADLSGRASNRSLSMSRNEAEQINWTLDLNDWEQYCRSINTDPRTLLIPGQTEVRIRRGNKYLCGGQLNYAYPYVSPQSQTLTLKATGFLNLFNDRVTGTTNAGTVQETWTATDGSLIASGLIMQSQAKTNGDFGITLGTIATTGPLNRNYSSSVIKNSLQDLTTRQSNSLDFNFTYDKKFNTYTAIGNNRPDVLFEYPNNITSIGAPIDATSLQNVILAKGQGNGSAGAAVEADNISSQLNYKLRENIVLSNANDDSDGSLTDAAQAELAAWAFPFEIPDLNINGNLAPFITDYGIGDRVRVRVKGIQSMAHIDGLYRIEAITLIVDEQDNETITLKVSI